MTRTLDQANTKAYQYAVQGGTPTTPAAGFVKSFITAEGLKIVDENGVVTKPYVSGDGALTIGGNLTVNPGDVIITAGDLTITGTIDVTGFYNAYEQSNDGFSLIDLEQIFEPTSSVGTLHIAAETIIAEYGGTATFAVGEYGALRLKTWVSTAGVIPLHNLNMIMDHYGAGTVPLAAQIYMETPINGGGGVITDFCGLYVEDMLVGVNNYPIYTNAGKIMFNAGGHADSDITWQSDTEANMFFGDASADALYFGGATNGIKIEKGGELSLIGTATVWNDIRVPVSSVSRLGFSDPSWAQFKDDGAGSVGVFALVFSNAADNEVYFTIQIPHSWKLGTDLDAHVHWSPSDTDTGTVSWNLEYTVADIGGTFGNTLSLVAADVGDGTAYKHQYHDLGDIDLSSYTDPGDVSIVINCRLWRDVSADSYAGTCFLHEVDFHYEIDTMGSKAELSK